MNEPTKEQLEEIDGLIDEVKRIQKEFGIPDWDTSE